MTAFRLLLLPAALLLVAGAYAADEETLKVDFGKKDEGKPTSPKAGHVTAFGRAVVPKVYTDPKVEVLIRPDPVDRADPGWKVHPAKLEDGKWTADITKLAAGTYRVHVRCVVTRQGDNARGEVYSPDKPEKSSYKVEVK